MSSDSCFHLLVRSSNMVYGSIYLRPCGYFTLNCYVQVQGSFLFVDLGLVYDIDRLFGKGNYSVLPFVRILLFGVNGF